MEGKEHVQRIAWAIKIIRRTKSGPRDHRCEFGEDFQSRESSHGTIQERTAIYSEKHSLGY